MKRLFGLTLAATTGLLLATAAEAAPLRVRGTVVAISSNAVTVRTTNGDVSASLDGNTAFVSVVPSDLNHVATGSYVGAASKTVGDKLIALSVMKEDDMNRLEKVLYTAKAHSAGGRSGVSRSSDGRLEVRLSRPGSPGTGTNPEQLFAAGWSACFDSAMEFAARTMKITLPADHAVDAEIDLGPEGGAFSLAARLYVSLPGMERATAQRLVEAAHEVCPYSRATHGNIAVETTLT